MLGDDGGVANALLLHQAHLRRGALDLQNDLRRSERRQRLVQAASGVQAQRSTFLKAVTQYTVKTSTDTCPGHRITNFQCTYPGPSEGLYVPGVPFQFLIVLANVLHQQRVRVCERHVLATLHGLLRRIHS